MSLETDIYDALTTDAGVAALIGTRLYRSRAEQKPTPPYVRMYQIRSRPSQGFDGSVQVERPIIVLQLFAVTDDETIAIRDAMRAAFLGLSYPVTLEDEISDSDAISGMRRRDLTMGVSRG